MNISTRVFEASNTLLEAEPPHAVRTVPILVLFPHSRCNCRCVMCDIWKIRQRREITARDLAPHMASLRALQVRWVVLSGGEPLLHSDLSGLAWLLRAEGIRVTLLTAGLVLERFSPTVATSVDDIIVSLDGPPQVHDEIRGIPGAFRRLTGGVEAVRRIRPAIPISARCTVQEKNFRTLLEVVGEAHKLGLDSISFLAVDATSEAFGRPQGLSAERQAVITLEAMEVEDLDTEVEALISECRKEIDSGFIAESDAKLRRIVMHYRAHLGQVPAVAPRCNAPWVSAVVEADGTVRPCFFHRPLGNLYEGPLHEIINSRDALAFRRQLDVSTDPVCRRCVCPLYVAPEGG